MKNHFNDYDETAVTKVAKLMKFFLGKLQKSQRDLDLHQNKLSFEEELTRQFIFLKTQIGEVQEKVVLLSELQNLLFEEFEGKDEIITSKRSYSYRHQDTINNFQNEMKEMEKLLKNKEESESEEFQSIDSFEEIELKQTKQTKKTPLFETLMKEKRISDYKRKTVLLKNSGYLTNAMKKKEEESKTKAFIQARKSQVFNANDIKGFFE